MLLLGYTPKPEISLVSPYGSGKEYAMRQAQMKATLCSMFLSALAGVHVPVTVEMKPA